jgi:hypothetical protein
MKQAKINLKVTQRVLGELPELNQNVEYAGSDSKPRRDFSTILRRRLRGGGSLRKQMLHCIIPQHLPDVIGSSYSAMQPIAV